jgi:hypothetical protein
MNAIHAASAASVNTSLNASLREGDALRKLSDFESITGRLEAGGRLLDAYELESAAGDQVRVRLTSEDFRVVGFVVLSASRSEPGREPFVHKIVGGAERTTGGVEGEVPITLPAGGTYRVVVTSVDNETHQQAVSSGEYRMTLLVDTPRNLPSRIVVSSTFASPSSAPEEGTGPGSQKGARFNAWESDSR